jgi:hypothetical protein
MSVNTSLQLYTYACIIVLATVAVLSVPHGTSQMANCTGQQLCQVEVHPRSILDPQQALLTILNVSGHHAGSNSAMQYTSDFEAAP